MGWLDVQDLINFSMGDEHLIRLMGDRAEDFSIVASSVMDKVWTLCNRLSVSGGEVDLARQCINAEVEAVAQMKIFMDDRGHVRSKEMDEARTVLRKGCYKINVDAAYKEGVG